MKKDDRSANEGPLEKATPSAVGQEGQVSGSPLFNHPIGH